MIYKLEKCDFPIIKNILEDVEYFPEAHAVIDRTNPGEIYVCDTINPKSALVWNQGMQSHYFIGESQNESFLMEIEEHFNDIILRDLQARDIDWFEAIGTSVKWEQVIEKLFSDKGIKYEYQLVYQMNENTQNRIGSMVGYGPHIQKLTRNVLNSDILNLDFMVDALTLFWGTIENFFKNGMCYLATENNKVISICYSGFKANGLYTIGIETLSGYRKKGYAYQLASRFIEQSISQNVSLHWDCSMDNEGSKRLAEKLGLSKVSEYKCYWFDL